MIGRAALALASLAAIAVASWHAGAAELYAVLIGR
jgi:hypothetical protein